MTQFVDEKDWDGVDFKKTFSDLWDLYSCTHSEQSLKNLEKFIKKMELIHKKQVKQVPILLKGDK